MSFTSCTIGHQWQNADGSAASGVVTFELTQRMTNGGVSIVPASEVTANLDGSGSISQSLISNLDAGTTPTGGQWQVSVRIAGCSVETYMITVPVGPQTIDLGTLLPETQQVQ